MVNCPFQYYFTSGINAIIINLKGEMAVTLHQKDYVNAYLIMGGAKKK